MATKKKPLTKIESKKQKPSRVEKAIEKLSKNLDNIDAKKTVEYFVDSDPSKSNKYLQWMVDQLIKGQNEEDIVGTVKSFHRRAKSLKHQDIYKYEDLKVLEKEILDLKPSKSERKDLKNLKEGRDYVILFEESPITLYYVGSYKGCKNLGKGTSWCIAANNSYWNSYGKNNNTFIIHNEGENVPEKYKKIAILTDSSGYPQNTAYDTNDTRFTWARFSSSQVAEKLATEMSLISRIIQNNRTTKTKKTKNVYFKFDHEKIPTKTHPVKSSLAAEVKEKNLLWVCTQSNNQTLLKELKQDIVKQLGNANGKIPTSRDYSKTFCEIFADCFNTDSAFEFLSKGSHTKTSVKAFEKVIKDLNKKEFTKFINNIKNGHVRKYVLEMQPKYWDTIKPEKVTASIAYYLVKTHGIKAMHLGYKHYGKRTCRWWGRDRYNSYTTWVNSEKHIPQEIINKLREYKDLPASFNTFLDKKDTTTLSTKQKKVLGEIINKVAISKGIKSSRVTSDMLDAYIVEQGVALQAE